MKKLLLSAGLLALGTVPAAAQTTGPAVAVVTSWVSGFSAGHFLIDRDGKTEVVDFSGTAVNTAAAQLKAHTEQAEALRLIIAKLYQEGYFLKGTLGTDLIFVKSQ